MGGAGGEGGAAGSIDATATGGAGGSSEGGGAPDAGTGCLPGDIATFSFFVTSTGSGDKGGDLGGLAGADAKCQSLAEAVGAGGYTWHAYLSTNGASPVNARDRIGCGPWYNARASKIAADLAQLHEEGGLANNLNASTALDEKGNPVPTSNPNEHDVLTGSAPDGRALPPDPDRTCNGWTSSSSGSAEVGHENRMGTNMPPASASWNSSHTTPDCSQAGFARVGGAGRLYCFALN
jgi:hypothetical protein